MRKNAAILTAFGAENAHYLGLKKGSAVQPWTFHPVHRVGPDGQLRFEVIVELLQREEIEVEADLGSASRQVYRGGVTLILNARDATVRYAVYKRVASVNRRKRQQECWLHRRESRVEDYTDGSPSPRADFASLHRGY
jgi:hypothetical protein